MTSGSTARIHWPLRRERSRSTLSFCSKGTSEAERVGLSGYERFPTVLSARSAPFWSVVGGRCVRCEASRGRRHRVRPIPEIDVRPGIAVPDQHQRRDDSEQADTGAGHEGVGVALGQGCPSGVALRPQVVDGREGDRREHRQPQRPSDLLGGVDQPARQAGLPAASALSLTNRGSRAARRERLRADPAPDRPRTLRSRGAATRRRRWRPPRSAAGSHGRDGPRSDLS